MLDVVWALPSFVFDARVPGIKGKHRFIKTRIREMHFVSRTKKKQQQQKRTAYQYQHHADLSFAAFFECLIVRMNATISNICPTKFSFAHSPLPVSSSMHSSHCFSIDGNTRSCYDWTNSARLVSIDIEFVLVLWWFDIVAIDVPTHEFSFASTLRFFVFLFLLL